MSQQYRAELYKKLWLIANTLRANSGIEPFEFKNYILGIIFYKFLSEKLEDLIVELLKDDEGLTYADAWEDTELGESLREEVLKQLGYFIEPKHLFSTLVAEIDKGDDGEFDTELLIDAVKSVTESTRGQDSEETFENLFDDMDLSSTKLGKTVKARSDFMAKILTSIDEMSFHHEDIAIDVLGDAYEYMIANFAASAGKKAGEFYTPQQVSKILSKIVTLNKPRIKDVYDPTCGSGSLLLRVAKDAQVSRLYGQELTSTTFNLARMNMLLHGRDSHQFDIKNGNTLTEPMHESMKFEAIVANPPYSANWNPTPATLLDERFSGYGKLAPSSKADFAFVQHMIHQLDDNGTMAVVLPHGVLFRGAAEGVIRKKLIENNYLDTVIGLPANIFFGTSIPTAILVFKKNREPGADVLFVDASQEFDKGKNQNTLTDANVEKIISTYADRETVEKYAVAVDVATIESNDYNLNIPRYVDMSVLEKEIDLASIEQKIIEIENELFNLSTLIEQQIVFLKGNNNV